MVHTPDPSLAADTDVRRTPSQASCALGDDAVVLQLERGIYHGLNPVAARVWELLEEPTTVSRIVDSILAEYEVDRERCEQDVKNLLMQMHEASLVVIGNESAA
ncbi:MAG: PqqD family protein [bacterium]|nr:PqqD family protein [bacterium]